MQVLTVRVCFVMRHVPALSMLFSCILSAPPKQPPSTNGRSQAIRREATKQCLFVSLFKLQRPPLIFFH